MRLNLVSNFEYFKVSLNASSLLTTSPKSFLSVPTALSLCASYLKISSSRPPITSCNFSRLFKVPFMFLIAAVRPIRAIGPEIPKNIPHCSPEEKSASPPRELPFVSVLLPFLATSFKAAATSSKSIEATQQGQPSFFLSISFL